MKPHPDDPPFKMNKFLKEDAMALQDENIQQVALNFVADVDEDVASGLITSRTSWQRSKIRALWKAASMLALWVAPQPTA